MFKKLVLTVASFIGISAGAEEILLRKDNTVIFNEVFTESSVAQASSELQALDQDLPKGQPLYLYLNTPGGSIDAGVALIRFAKSLNHEVKTLTSFAASMGFMTVEQLGERLILADGSLMAHRARIGLDGQIPGEFNVRSEFYMHYITEVEKRVASRLELSLSDYRTKVLNEWWLVGQQAVDAGAADRVVTAKCAKDLSGTYVKTINVIFFSIDVTFSECPLIEGPVAIGQPEGSLVKFYPLEAIEAQKIVNTLFTDKYTFIKDYITTDKYLGIFR